MKSTNCLYVSILLQFLKTTLINNNSSKFHYLIMGLKNKSHIKCLKESSKNVFILSNFRLLNKIYCFLFKKKLKQTLFPLEMKTSRVKCCNLSSKQSSREKFNYFIPAFITKQTRVSRLKENHFRVFASLQTPSLFLG